jgi:hypothetical protein
MSDIQTGQFEEGAERAADAERAIQQQIDQKEA